MAGPSIPASELSSRAAEHRSAIERYVRGLVRDPAVAEDLTQETFLRAQRGMRTLDDPDRLVPWLYRIATNLCTDRFRRSSRRPGPGPEDSSPEALADASPRLDEAMERKEMSACVQEYLTALSDDYRAAILLHDLADLTGPEIAEMLGLSLATVKIRIHRARAKLRVALSEGCAFSTDARGVLVCEPKPRGSG